LVVLNRSALREETEDDYHLHREEHILYSMEEMDEFIKKVDKLTKKD